MSKCNHPRVTCINPYEIIRKYRCEVCGEVMMCACDEDFARRFLPHQIHEGFELSTNERVPVTLGFQPNICNTCRGLPEEPYPKAEIYGYTSKVRRYYWREIFMETTRRFAAWAKAQGYVNYHIAQRDNPSVYAEVEKEVVAEIKEMHKRSPKYRYDEEPQSVVLERNKVEIVHLEADYVKTSRRKAMMKCEERDVCTVEEFVALYYRGLGYRVIFAESAPFHVIFGVFMWELIQDRKDPRIRLAMFGERSSYEEEGKSVKWIRIMLPQDFGKPTYVHRRSASVERHFRQIPYNRLELLELFDKWLKPSYGLRQYLWAHRAIDVERARRIVAVLPGDVTHRILRYLVESYWKRYVGWPDLVIHRGEEYCFVEVKSSRDKLNETQKRWINDNTRFMQLPFKLAKVHRRS